MDPTAKSLLSPAAIRSEELQPYDVNFCFPIRELSNDLVKLTPFIPSIHANTYFTLSHPHPELYAHLPWGPFPTSQSFVDELVEGRIHHNPAHILFAVIDKTRLPTHNNNEIDKEGALAGIIGYLNTSSSNLSTELGFLIILPSFQRTHVTSNAIGLLLQYALDLPSDGGLGLRRVQWQANSLNAASIRAAERMEFKREAVLRWDRVLKNGKVRGKIGNGRELLRDSEERDGHLGRDTVMLSLCWDDWEGGGREKVLEVMRRR